MTHTFAALAQQGESATFKFSVSVLPECHAVAANEGQIGLMAQEAMARYFGDLRVRSFVPPITNTAHIANGGRILSISTAPQRTAQ